MSGAVRIDLSPHVKSRPQGGKATANPAKRIAVGRKKRRRERALRFEKIQNKRFIACFDMANNPNYDASEPPFVLGGSFCVKGRSPGFD